MSGPLVVLATIGLLAVPGGAAGSLPEGETVSGYAFRDVDFDGVHDPAEPALPGVGVTVTDAGGGYLFRDRDLPGGAPERSPGRAPGDGRP